MSIQKAVEGKNNVCIDVILSSSCRVVGAGFFTVDCAPWVEGTFKVQLCRTLFSLWQNTAAVFKKLFCNFRRCISENRADVAFCIPEEVAFVAFACKSLSTNTGFSSTACRLQKVEKTEVKCLFAFIIALNFDFCDIPEVRKEVFLFCYGCIKTAGRKCRTFFFCQLCKGFYITAVRFALPAVCYVFFKNYFLSGLQSSLCKNIRNLIIFK